jgi:pyrroline-5-carboxylate reductase
MSSGTKVDGKDSAAALLRPLPVKKLTLIGAGKIGEALLSSILGAQLVPVSRVVATDADPPRADYIGERYGVNALTNNRRAVAGADLVMLSVKPQQVTEVLRDIRRSLPKNSLVISVAAGVTTALIERELDHGHRVIRVMPNTPCLIRQGMTAICRGKHATQKDLTMAQAIFSAMGRTVVVDEKHMDAITGLSASGPAYVYMIIESLAEGGVKLGLPRELSTELSAQTLLGSSALVLHTGEHPAKLKDIVTTPAGCTIDGLLELEEGGLRVTLIKAVVRAAERARELVES